MLWLHVHRHRVAGRTAAASIFNEDEVALMSASLIDGKIISAAVRQQVTDETAAFLAQTGVTPHLAAVLVGGCEVLYLK